MSWYAKYLTIDHNVTALVKVLHHEENQLTDYDDDDQTSVDRTNVKHAYEQIERLLSNFKGTISMNSWDPHITVFGVRDTLLAECLSDRIDKIFKKHLVYNPVVQFSNGVSSWDPIEMSYDGFVFASYELYRREHYRRWLYHYLKDVDTSHHWFGASSSIGFCIDNNKSVILKFEESNETPTAVVRTKPQCDYFDYLREPLWKMTYKGQEVFLSPYAESASKASDFVDQERQGVFEYTVEVTHDQLIKGYIAKRRLHTINKYFRSRKVRQQIEKWRKSLWVPPHGALCVRGFTEIERTLQKDK